MVVWGASVHIQPSSSQSAGVLPLDVCGGQLMGGPPQRAAGVPWQVWGPPLVRVHPIKQQGSTESVMGGACLGIITQRKAPLAWFSPELSDDANHIQPPLDQRRQTGMPDRQVLRPCLQTDPSTYAKKRNQPSYAGMEADQRPAGSVASRP